MLTILISDVPGKIPDGKKKTEIFREFSPNINWEFWENWEFILKDIYLQGDGWSNVRNEPIVSFIITKPEPIFVEFISTKENRHTTEYLAKCMADIISKYGPPKKFFSVIGDNAANMQAALRELKVLHPHLTILGCLAHTLHLCGDILKTKSIQKLMSQAIDIVKKFRNVHLLNAMFIEINKERKINMSLKLPGKTRWGSSLDCLNSISASKVTLQTIAVREDAALSLTRDIKNCILDEAVFWVRVEKIIKLLSPIVSWIRKLQTNDPIVHKVLPAVNDIDATIIKILPDAPITKNEEKEISTAFIKRKGNILNSIHFAAYSLDPLSEGYELKPEQKLEAIEFIYNVASDMGLDAGIIMSDLSNYQSKDDLWAKNFVWESKEI